VTNKKGKTYKRFKGIIKDLVFNNPRADRQLIKKDDQDEYDRSMLYDFMKTVYKKDKLP
tara:strand:- start:744 stop:920 length:177 start_codon:yes stop_codon:yes gene_type:complete